MPQIRLQFIAEAALGSEMIEWFSAGHLSHVDAVTPDGQLLGARSDEVGGQASGVRTRPPGYLRFSRRVVTTIDASADQEREFYDFLKAQLGKPYDLLAIAAFAAGRNWRSEHAWFCSELQARALEVAGIFPRPLYLAENKITPVSLILTASALPAIDIAEFPARSPPQQAPPAPSQQSPAKAASERLFSCPEGEKP